LDELGQEIASVKVEGSALLGISSATVKA